MGPELNRTLTMPQGGIEGELALPITHVTGSTGVGLALGGRYGIMPNLNAGAMLAFTLSPNGDFNVFTVNAEYEFLSGNGMMGAARVDLGASKLGGGMVSETGFDIGLGLPFKYMITPMIAFISGSQYSFNAFGLGSGSDILFFTLASDITVINLNIPVGILVQFTPMIAGELNTGFALVHASSGGFSTDTKFVPLALTVEGNLNLGGVGLDPYFTFAFPGNTDDYGGTIQFIIGARLHL